jgi:hypothetical protein
MWDLTVDTAHSFFVGSGAVLVHNCDLFHGTDAISAADIVQGGINQTEASMTGGGDVFWTTTSQGDATIYAEVSPGVLNGGSPAVVGITLPQGGLQAAIESGLLSQVDGMPGVYVVSNWGGFNAVVNYTIVK